MIKRNTTDGNHTIVLRSPITATPAVKQRTRTYDERYCNQSQSSQYQNLLCVTMLPLSLVNANESRCHMCLTHCEIPMNQPKNHPQTVKDRLGILFRSKPQLCVCTNAYKEETKLDWKSPNEFGGNVPKMFPRERPARLYTYYYSFTNEAEIVVAMCGNIRLIFQL